MTSTHRRFHLLKDDNPCSRFFGGPRVAVTVLPSKLTVLSGAPEPAPAPTG